MRLFLLTWLTLVMLLLPQQALAANDTGNVASAAVHADCDSCRMRIDQLDQPFKLSGNWLFTRDDVPANKDVDLDTRDWRLLKAPGRWAGAYGDGKNFKVGWYRGTFAFDQALVGQEVVVLINAYMSRVTVYVDGVEVYRRPGNVNVDHYFAIQPIPVRFTINRPNPVIAIRIDTPLMVGIYQLPFELRKYRVDDHNLTWHHFWGGEVRGIASFVLLFFGLFFLRIYIRSKARMYLVASLTLVVVSPFYVVTSDNLLAVVAPEVLLAVHYVGLYSLFLAYLFCQFLYRFTPRLNWILGSIYALMALTVVGTAIQGELDLFQKVRSAYFLTGGVCMALALYQSVRAAMQKAEGAIILCMGSFVLLTITLHDMLMASGVFASVGLTSIAALGFMVSMLYVASTTFTNTYVENQRLVKDLGAVNENLELIVAERVEDLSKTIQTLQLTQRDLVEAEKLASLGSLVAGISHELNTPIGNALVAASALQDQMNQLQLAVADGQLRKSTLTEFMRNGAATADLVFRSCDRASALVRSFKQVAVDQTSEQRRTFNLQALVNDVVTMLKPTFRHEPWEIDIQIPDTIECDSYPGPVGQVVTNMVQNAMIHAFEGRDQGRIRVTANCTNGVVEVCCEDDGCGMSAGVLNHIFEPFFTTRLGKGGSGLGLSVSRNIAVGVLGGTLTASSMPEMGTCFVLTFPIVAPQPQESA